MELPRSLDVVVNISTPQTEIATDMSLACLIVPAADCPYGDSDTIKFYSTAASAQADFPNTTSAWWAIAAFFAQTNHPATLAIGKYSGASLTEAATAIAAAARLAGRPVYGWLLDASYRDTGADLNAFAAWVEAQTAAIAILETNSVTAYDTGDTANIGYVCKNAGYTRTAVVYSDDTQTYADASAMARLLGVDYAATNSTLTMKFKDLPGIATVPLTETQLSNLESRRINTFVAIGNNSRCFREGVMASSTYFMDDRTNLDNFVEQLQVAVYNVFLRNKKVPYTPAGQSLLSSACAQICEIFVNNGSFAPRQIADEASETGYTVAPAYFIDPSPIYLATASNRAARIAPPIAITVYLAGAMHKVTINVDVIS